MKISKHFSALLGTLFLFGSLAFPALAFAQTPGSQQPAANPPAQTQPAKQQRQQRERHPELRRAMKALQRAKYALRHGAHDFSGHRAKALELVDQAISEVKQAWQSDKNKK